jgi:tRNA pseudouridine38-40 synthase
MPHQRDRNALAAASSSLSEETSETRQRFAIRIAYDGTTYQGFQSQPYGNTIQDQIEHRLRNLLKRNVRVIAWGRTDAGVHARGAVVSVDLSMNEVESLWRMRGGVRRDGESLTQDEVRHAVDGAAQLLQGVLKQFACNTGISDREAPARFGSISATSVTPVPMDFDARYSALWKRYVYYVYSCPDSHCEQHLPFGWMRHAWRVKHELDFDVMFQAAELLNGKEHNYEWLSVSQEGELRDPCRTVQMTIDLVPEMSDHMPYFLGHSQSAKVYKITATCDFFLYKMMRRIVGMLVSLGRGCASLSTLATCIQANDDELNVTIPKELVETAPAHGLCLEHVEYSIPI